jgi:uncharacterized RDD family membrane protein YckC
LQCPKCGVESPDDSESCRACGEPFPSSSISQPGSSEFAPARRQVVYAGFWLRAVAYLLDLVLVTMIAYAAIYVPLVARGSIPTDKPWFLLTEKSRQIFAIELLVQMICWLYFASFESSAWQATPGKKMLGLVVTDIKGRRVTFARASGRFWGKLLSQFIFFLGFVMAGFTERKQALHDMIARCLVVRKA